MIQAQARYARASNGKNFPTRPLLAQGETLREVHITETKQDAE